MPITALPTPPSRADDPTTFSAKSDALLGALPAFVTETNATAATIIAANANVDAAMAAGLANAATNATTATTQAGTATTQAGIATTKAGEADASAIAAAASASSISGGPVASVNGLTGVVTGIATQAGTETLTNKTFTGYTETQYSLTGTDLAVSNGTIQYKTLSGNTTFTESLADGQGVILMLNPSTYTTTWPTTTWIGTAASTAPTLIASVYNCLVFFQMGGTLYGRYVGRV